MKEGDIKILDMFRKHIASKRHIFVWMWLIKHDVVLDVQLGLFVFHNLSQV